MWDYPVREQYTHLLKVIKDTGTFVTPEDGFEAVDRATEGNFAFIHDASEVCTRENESKISKYRKCDC